MKHVVFVVPLLFYVVGYLLLLYLTYIFTVSAPFLTS